ncbi:MAG: hypothetical protein HY859_04015 [Caulobacterales bacterium]|nr:hypothetical protein [Caulobacterales bacterium]
MKRLAFTLLLLAPTSALAGETAQVADLAWMAGSWSQDTANGTVRETWLPPLREAMAGMTQTHRPGKPPVTEFSTITREPAGVTFTAYVGGQPPTAFVLKPGRPGEAVFENLAHDFPQRVIYRQCEANLCARIEGTVQGQVQGMDWRYRRLP